jgi:tryptophan synthase alpha subunit
VQTKTDSLGHRDTVQEENKQSLAQIREAGIDLPLVFAYGIKTPADVRKCIGLGADGVLIGTVLLDAAHRLSRAEYKNLLISLRGCNSNIEARSCIIIRTVGRPPTNPRWLTRHL